MGELIQYAAGLPDFLKDPAYFPDSVLGGISAGGHPRISTKSSRFRLIDAAGEELIVNQLNLDLVVLFANPGPDGKGILHKSYYAGGWDPKRSLGAYVL